VDETQPRVRDWLARKDAAARVVRSERTIRDWITRGLLYTASDGSVSSNSCSRST
jgi:hypothetical protein